MIDRARDLFAAIYLLLALIGWMIALFEWENPPLGFEIIANVATWVALVWLCLVIAGFVLRGLDKLASR